jgi:23S rRNA (uracil1939-C5)-methyltransferase
VAQRATPTVRIGRATVTLPPGAFLQATALGEETLARLVLAHAGGAKAVADLFAGVGPFALRLAERARVLAADSDAGAIETLRRAADATSGLKPVIAERRDLFRRPFVAQELAGLDAVVFDPPRQGAEMQARELAKSRVPVIVAVSCNPVTFARDAKILIDGGYRVGEVAPVDQFRYSAHVEIVARLAK